MATENVTVVKIETGKAQTETQKLRQELKELKNIMLQVEEGSKEYNDALQQAANIQHRLKEQMEEINASAMDFGQIAGNVVKGVGGIVAGFQAAKATMNLFGIENETVIKSLERMQNLMALTQAIPAIDDAAKAFKRLGLAIKGATIGMSSLKKALISTGIGAAVVAVGLLVANFDKLKAAITGTNDELEEQKQKQMDEHLKKINDELGKRLSLEEQIRKAGGQDDLTIAEERVKSIEKEIKKKEALIEANGREAAQAWVAYNNAVQAGKAQSYTNQLKEKAQEIDAKESVYLKDIETIRNGQLKTAKEQLEIEKKLQAARDIKAKQEEAAKAAEEARKTAEENRKKRIEEEKKAVEELRKKYGELAEDIKLYDATDYEKDLASLDKAEKQSIKTIEDAQKKGIISKEQYEKDKLNIEKYYTKLRDNAQKEEAQRKREETIESIDTTYQLEQAKLQKQYDEGLISEQAFIDEKKKLLETYVKNYVNTIQLMLDTEKGLTNDQILDLTNKINDARALLKPEEKDGKDGKDGKNETSTETVSLAKGISDAVSETSALLTELGDNPAWGNILNNVSKIALVFDDLNKNHIKKGSQEAFNAYMQVAALGFGAVGQMLNGLAAEQKTSTKEGFETAKKMQIASATMTTLSSVLQAYAAGNSMASQMGLAAPVGWAMGAAMASMVGALGAVNIAKIAKQKFEDPGNASVSTPNTSAVNSVIAPVQYTQDVQGASIEGAIKDSKVYVTETDISNTQNKVSVTENEARF